MAGKGTGKGKSGKKNEDDSTGITLPVEVRPFARGAGGRLAVPVLIQLEGPEPGFCHKLVGLAPSYVIGRQEGVEIRIADETVSRRHAVVQFHDGSDGPSLTFKDLKSTNGLVVDGERVAEAVLRPGEEVLLGNVLLRFDLHDVKAIEYQERIVERARRAEVDILTGLFARRFLPDQIPTLYAECVREGLPLTLLMMDLDHFKSVNDRFGHHVGDEVLVRAGAIVRRSIHEGDIAIRYGGEELMVVLPGTRLDLAERIAHRVWQAFHEEPWASAAPELAVTISIGVAERRPDEDFEALTRRTDVALYEAKRAGRDRVVSDMN